MLKENPAAPLILLVEDDVSHAAAIHRSFQNAGVGYHLETVGTLHAAREAITRLHPALVLADYQLPDGKGSDLAGLVNGICPIVLLTARGSEQIAVQALKAGVQDYVIKSVETFAQVPDTVSRSLMEWSLVSARKQAEEALRCYARRLVEAEEELRKKLAAEIHDEIARDLTVLGMNLSIIRSSLADVVPQKLSERIEDSVRLIEVISCTARNMMVNLRPPVLDDYGLISALRWHGEIFTARTGIAVEIQDDGIFPRVQPDVELALFRIAQEALMNTAKYADATTVTISLKYEASRVGFIITDDGNGFVPPASLHPQLAGWGMTNMRERAELVGGTFSLDSHPGQGATITVEIPLEGQIDAGQNSDCR